LRERFDGVAARLDRDPATTHLVCDGSGCARTGEAVEHDVTGIRGDLDDPLHEALGLGCRERHRLGEKAFDLSLRLPIASYFLDVPDRVYHAIAGFAQE